MKIFENIAFLFMLILIVYVLNHCLSSYNNMLEGMCNNIALCDFKPLYQNKAKSNWERPMRDKEYVDPTTTLYPDLSINNNIPIWPTPCQGNINKEPAVDNNSYTVPANAWTHPPTQDSITPFKLKRPPQVNQPYQELFVPDEFTINYPCHPSITGAFTTCGPNGFGGFCPASNNYSTGGI